MTVKKTVIEAIEPHENGIVHIKFGILEMDEDGNVVSRRIHRSAVEPGGNVDAQIAAVNADITTRETLMAQPVEVGRVSEIKAVCSLAHTPEKIRAYRDSVNVRGPR